MANENVRQGPTPGDSPDTPDKMKGWPDRLDLALVSTYEIEALSTLMVKKRHDDGDIDADVVKGAFIRCRELTRVIMSALGDERADLEEMFLTVTGIHREASNGKA